MLRYPGLQRGTLLLGLVGVGALAYRAYGVAGLALAGGGVVMWALLQWTRVMLTLRRAARRPVGHVPSAVMLHARLRPQIRLLDVTALAGALGQRIDASAAREGFRWTDPGGAWVDCQFEQGVLQEWHLQRPAASDPASPPVAGS